MGKNASDEQQTRRCLSRSSVKAGSYGNKLVEHRVEVCSHKTRGISWRWPQIQTSRERDFKDRSSGLGGFTCTSRAGVALLNDTARRRREYCWGEEEEDSSADGVTASGERRRQARGFLHCVDSEEEKNGEDVSGSVPPHIQLAENCDTLT